MTTAMIYLVDDIDSTVKRILSDDELGGFGLNKTKVRRALASFQGDEIATSVFLKKYALRNAEGQTVEFTIDEAKDRWAQALADSEKLSPGEHKPASYFRELYEYFLPAGRQMFALGNNFVRNITLTNCYVTKIEDDSIEGIYEAARKLARTYSYGGGIGLCVGELRPKGAKVSNSARQSTGSVSFMELFSLTTGLIGQAGRRGALMITIPVSHPDAEEFIEIKHGDTNKVKYANISLKLTDEFMQAVLDDRMFRQTYTTKHETICREVRARDLWQKIIQSARDSAEPGLMFWDRMVEMSPSEIYPRLQVNSTNPCVTGDTLVYVADGRGNVPIRQLAEEGKDVPVFCVDKANKPVVRTMRNPRLTGRQVPVYKVTFTNGTSLRVTGNHKFCLTNGGERAALDLKSNDSILSLTSYHAAFEELFPGSNSKSTDYRWVCVKGRTFGEHRLIAAYQAHMDSLPVGRVVHHRDHNSLNNNPSNLEIMSKQAHDQLHRIRMIGDNNPMRRAATEWSAEKWAQYSQHMSEVKSGPGNGRWNGVTDEELKQHALILTRRLKVRFSDKDWREYAHENGLVEQFSKWRNDHLGGILGLAKWAVVECGIEHVDLDPRTTKFYLQMLSEGYNCHIKNEEVWISKRCEVCGKNFEIRAVRREHGICSKECHAAYVAKRNRNSDVGRRAIEGMKAFYQEKKRANANAMVEVFLDLKAQLGREPLLKELRQACKARHLACRVGPPSFFASYDELRDYASNYNHRVVSVEYDGLEDVYNGTVDEFHNFCVGGWEGLTSSKKPKHSYILSVQCGEQVLEPGGACVLGSLLLHTFVVDPFTPQARFDFDLLRQMARRAVRHLDNVVELNLGRHALAEQEEAAGLGRRIGLGITGLADALASMGVKYDSEEAIQLVDQIMSAKKEAEYKASIDLAMARGSFKTFDHKTHYEQGFCATLPEDIKALGRERGQRNVAISTVAPAGSLSVIAQCSSGIEPVFALRYKRYVELGLERKEFSVRHQGLSRMAAVLGSETTPWCWVTAHSIDHRFRVAMQSVIQGHTDASISSTINLPKDATAETVGEIYMEAWKAGLKGITVYREGAREGILVTEEFAKQAGAPMDTIIYEARAEAGDKFYIPVSYKDGDVRRPYQVFLINYKTSENDRFAKMGNDLVRMLREKGVENADPERFQKYLDRGTTQLGKLTRFLSLSMKTGFFEEAVEILGEHGTVGTLAAELHKILRLSVAAAKVLCPSCDSPNVRMEEGCRRCPDCGWSGCG